MTCVPSADRSVWFQMCRGFEHEGVTRVCGWLTGSDPKTSLTGLVLAARESADLRMFARLFRQLRDERERADYSHEIVIDRSMALTMIEHAREALDILDTGSYEDAPWRAFVALMVGESKARSYELPAKRDDSLP